MTREEFIMAAEITFEKLMTPTRGLSPAQMEEPMAEGKWSFKDLAAHIIYWDGLAVRALEALMQDRPVESFPYDRKDEVNAEAVERLRSQAVKRVMNELRITHSTLVEAARRVPEDKLFVNGELPSWLIRIAISHLERHTPQVTAWAESRRQP
jgi:hypothetical protein